MRETGEQPCPPSWAEAVLRTLLQPQDRESVSGDLLEEYRAGVFPSRGRLRADRWYVRQVMGFLWRATWQWGVLLAAASIIRGALDWFVPPASFYARAIVTTYTAIGLFLAAGFWTAWRTRSLGAGILAGLGMGVIAAAIDMAGTAIMIGIWHDPLTLAAIERSGGLAEMFELPLLRIVPGMLLATIGALAATGGARFVRSHAVE
jgi:hypothetical protein